MVPLTPIFLIRLDVVPNLCMVPLTPTFPYSEKALVERAFELRAELENAASDVSNLFAKIG